MDYDDTETPMDYDDTESPMDYDDTRSTNAPKNAYMRSHTEAEACSDIMQC